MHSVGSFHCDGCFFTEIAENDTLILIITLYRRKSNLSIASEAQLLNQQSASSSEESAKGSSTDSISGSPAKGSAVTRVLDILDAVATADRPVTPSELCEQLGIPKATVHRLCTSLEDRGLLESRMNGRGLLPGQALHRLALGVLASSAFRAQRHAVLTALSENIGETCNIAIPDGSSMTYFDRVETHWPVRVQLPVGCQVPVHCTAAGKMYLSSLSGAKQRRILESLPLDQRTPNTVVDPEKLLVELAETAERGFSKDNEEYIEGMVALAVPLTEESGRIYATLSFHAPCMRIGFTDTEDYLPALQSAAHELMAISAGG